MLQLEGSAILFHGFTGSEDLAEDRFPCVRPEIADRFIRMFPFKHGEEIRKRQRDDRPLGVLFIKSAVATQHGMDCGIKLDTEFEAAMPRRGVKNHTFGIDRRTLRRAPGSIAVDPRRPPGKANQLAAMFRLFEHPRTECRLILDPAVVRIEVVACEIGKWSRNAPGRAQKTLTVAPGHQGEGKVSDARHGQTVCTSSKFHP